MNGAKRRNFGDKQEQRTRTFMTTARDFLLLFLLSSAAFVFGKFREIIKTFPIQYSLQNS